MKPTLSFSCALAPATAAIAKPVAAAAIMNFFIALSELLREALSGCGARLPRFALLNMCMILSENRFPLFGIMRQNAQRSGTKASPSEAGAGLPARPLHHEIATKTTMVARYGSDDISCDGMPMPIACA